VIQAFRHEPGSLTRQWPAAHQMLAHYRMPEGRDVAQVFISWAQKRHWHWFIAGERADNPFRPADWFPPDDSYPHSDETTGAFRLHPS
jgi:hypothetical protein